MFGSAPVAHVPDQGEMALGWQASPQSGGRLVLAAGAKAAALERACAEWKVCLAGSAERALRIGWSLPVRSPYEFSS